MKPQPRDPKELLEKSLDRFRDPAPTPEQMESAGERVLQRLLLETPLRSHEATPTAGPRWRAALAGAMALVVLALGTYFHKPKSRIEAPVTVVSADILRIGQTVRTNANAGAQYSLADGSRIEMATESELSLESAADGVRLWLNAGAVIVTAAKQRSGHLYVQTPDCLVSVVGTVFLVRASEKGSQVAVIQGEVHVQQGTTLTRLLPGQQTVTNPSIPTLPVPEEISWSRNAVAHIAMLQQSEIPGGGDASSQATGSIELTVRDSMTGQALPGSRLTLILLRDLKNDVTNSVTDSNGHMAFTKLLPGNYVVEADSVGYVDFAFVEDPTAAHLTIGPEKRNHVVDIRLIRGATISGRILGPDGAPLPKVHVSAARKTYQAGLPILVTAVTSRGYMAGETDDLGYYRITAVPPGEYLLELETRPPGGMSIFKVRSPREGLPMATYYPGVTDVAQAVSVQVKPGMDLQGMNFSIPKTPTFTISGTVVNTLPGGAIGRDGQPSRYISFRLGPADATSFDPPRDINLRTIENSATPNETRFVLSSVTPGSYYLYPLFDTGMSSPLTANRATKRTRIDVTDHDVEGVTIVLQPNATLKGRFVLNGEDTGIRWDSVRVNLRAKEHLPTNEPFSGQVSKPETREFSIAGVMEGKYGVVVSGLPEDAYISDVRVGARSIQNEGVFDVTGGMDEPIEITVARRGGVVEGMVRNGKQEAIGNVGVVLVPSSPRRGNSALYKRMKADNSGRFSFRGIAPGEYKVLVWTDLPDGEAEQSEEFLSSYETRGVSVRVNAGQTSSVRVVVDR